MSLLSLVGCEGSETGNPSLGSLQMQLRSTDETIASVVETDNAIHVEQLWLSISSVALVGCGVDAAEVTLNRESITGDLAQGVAVGDIPAAEYCGVRLLLAPASLPVTAPGVAAPASIAVSGARADGVPFVVLSAAPLDVMVPGTAFTVRENEAFLLAFDIAAWLRAGVLDGATLVDGTAVLDGREHPSVTSVFESQLTVTLHHDANANGVVDESEAALATLH
jgi:hypothetical protein